MNQDQKRERLLRFLLDETPRYRGVEIPGAERDQKHLLRFLMNLRAPMPIHEAFLEMQDAYLQEELSAKGITDADSLPTTQANPKLVLWRGDITTLKADAIVNAANSGMLGCFIPCHSCIDNAIHSAAGLQLRMACDEIMQEQGFSEPTGTAKITKAYNLPSRYVLHTVGPIISRKLTQRDCDLLASCYRSCLDLAEQHGLKSVALCCISTGEFHFPQEKAAEIAIKTVTEFLTSERQIQKVIFNVFTENDYEIYRKLLAAN